MLCMIINDINIDRKGKMLDVISVEYFQPKQMMIPY